MRAQVTPQPGLHKVRLLLPQVRQVFHQCIEIAGLSLNCIEGFSVGGQRGRGGWQVVCLHVLGVPFGVQEANPSQDLYRICLNGELSLDGSNLGHDVITFKGSPWFKQWAEGQFSTIEGWVVLITKADGPKNLFVAFSTTPPKESHVSNWQPQGGL